MQIYTVKENDRDCSHVTNPVILHSLIFQRYCDTMEQ